MAFEAQFVSGCPEMVDYTPSGAAVSSGQVVVTGDTTRIAHDDIADGALGALAAVGGVYLCTGDAAIAADKKVYWDNTNNKVTESAAAGANKPFGITVTACPGNNATCSVRHDPAA